MEYFIDFLLSNRVKKHEDKSLLLATYITRFAIINVGDQLISLISK